MANRFAVASILISVCIVSPARAQSAQHYFEELRSEKGRLSDSDEYVCFPDKDDGVFDILTRTKDLARASGSSEYKDIGDYLLVKSFYKNVPASGVAKYTKVKDSSSDSEWQFELPEPLHYRSVYMINWDTGRYRHLVFVLDASAEKPAHEDSGKCRLIPCPPGTSQCGKTEMQGAGRSRAFFLGVSGTGTAGSWLSMPVV